MHSLLTRARAEAWRLTQLRPAAAPPAPTTHPRPLPALLRLLLAAALLGLLGHFVQAQGGPRPLSLPDSSAPAQAGAILHLT